VTRRQQKSSKKSYLTLPNGHVETTKIGLLDSWALCFSPRPIHAVVAVGDEGDKDLSKISGITPRQAPMA
jgi:hypothetical protein